jgi:hypothetical protein
MQRRIKAMWLDRLSARSLRVERSSGDMIQRQLSSQSHPVPQNFLAVRDSGDQLELRHSQAESHRSPKLVLAIRLSALESDSLSVHVMAGCLSRLVSEAQTPDISSIRPAMLCNRHGVKSPRLSLVADQSQVFR